MDLMYVNKIPLLVTLSQNVKFGTVEAVMDRKQATMLKCIANVATLYRKAGFKVTMALMDGEFVPLRGGLAEIGVTLNETSRDEHMGDIERYIRTIKERMRSIYNTMPFHKVPARLVIEMAKTAVFWFNAFPVLGGASRDLSPRTILTGQKVDYKRHCRFQFGDYTQTHEELNNSMNPRTVGALALRPVGNGQGSFYFLSVATGRVLNRLHATALPMPDGIIDKIHQMARQQKNNPGLIFADRNLNPDEDDDDDDDMTYHDDDNDDSDGDDDDPHDHNNNNNDGDDDDDESSYYRSDNDDDDGEDNNGDDDPLGDDDNVDTNDDDASDGIGNDPVITDAPEEDEVQGNEPLPVDNPPLDDIEEHPDNLPGEIPGVGIVEQEAEDGAGPLVDSSNDGDELGIPGVGDDGEDDTSDINDEQSGTTPNLKVNTVGGYGLRNKRNRDYNLLQDTGETGEGRVESNDNPAESNDNPADSIGRVRTSSGNDAQMHAVNISNDIIKDGVSNTQNQQRLINSK